MIKKYISIIKKYSSLGANHKKFLLPLLFTAFLRDISVLGLPIFSSFIISNITDKNYTFAFISIFLLALNYLIYNIIYHLNYKAYAKNTNYVYTKLQENVVDKVIHYDEGFSKKISKSFLVNTVSNDIWYTCMFADEAIDCLSHFITVIVVLVIVFLNNLYIGLISLFFNLIYLILVKKLNDKKAYYLSMQRKQQDKIVELLGQVLDGNKEIRSFNMNEDLNKYLDIHKKNWTSQYFKKRIYWDGILTLPVIFEFGKVILYLGLLFGLSKGIFTVGSIVLLIGYFERVEKENKTFYDKYNKVINNSVRIDRLSSIMNYKNKNMLLFGEKENNEIVGYVSFSHVDFYYEKEKTLKDISFEIKPNCLVAIVGKSGSGKSTIFRALLRLYKIDKGKIYIDGEDIYEYSKDIYPKIVSIATQKPFIFNMSIRENLNLVDSNRENQIKACRRVGIHEFIKSLPKGYNTVLSEDANNVSGGQKQLLALARTLLSQAKILLFDEITASLDPNTEKHIRKVLKDLKKDHTVIMITHKPSLMRLADQLIVMNQGKVIAFGKHKQLMEENSYYQLLQK